MKPISILVVDDDEPTLQILRHWLDSLGHRIEGATSGHEALKAIAARPPDLVITDVLMPDGNGLDLIGQVKQQHPAIRILAISGGGPHATSSTCLVRAHHSGAHALLLKPFKPDQLLEAMRYVMGNPEPPTVSGKVSGADRLRMKERARALSAAIETEAPIRSRSREFD